MKNLDYDPYGTHRGWHPLYTDARDYEQSERVRYAYETMLEFDRVAKENARKRTSTTTTKTKKAVVQQVDELCKTDANEGTVNKKDEESNMTKTGEKSVFDSVVDTVTTTTKEDAVDASWRTAAAEATEIAKPVAKQILKEVGGTFAKPLIAGIDTPIGTGAVSWVTGWAIMGYGPLRGKTLGPKTMRLSKELRIAGIQPLTDALAKRFVAPMRKRLTALLEDLPSLVGES